jgi:hypothetical protein
MSCACMARSCNGTLVACMAYSCMANFCAPHSRTGGAEARRSRGVEAAKARRSRVPRPRVSVASLLAVDEWAPVEFWFLESVQFPVRPSVCSKPLNSTHRRTHVKPGPF